MTLTWILRLALFALLGALTLSGGCFHEAVPVPSRNPLLIGMTLHLEGWQRELRDEGGFRRYAELNRLVADIFEAHSAKLTYETRDVFRWIPEYDDNFLAEMVERGHAVGNHLDIGGKAREEGLTLRQYIRQASEPRQRLADLGIDSVHASGICTSLDWVTGLGRAGYHFTTGVVGECLASLPPRAQPPDYRDCLASAEVCHEIYPPDLERRIRPWRAESGRNWTEPSDRGPLVVFPSMGQLYCLHEMRVGQRRCEFNEKDIAAYIEELDAALASMDEDRVYTLYPVWSFLNHGNEILDDETIRERLHKWLEAIQPYVDSGQVAWATLPEMYEAYLQWEGSQ